MIDIMQYEVLYIMIILLEPSESFAVQYQAEVNPH